MVLLHRRGLRLRRNCSDLSQPLLFPLLGRFCRSIRIEEACRDTTRCRLLATHPGVEECAPAELFAAKTLKFPVSGDVVVRQTSFGVFVTGWETCDDAYWSRGGFREFVHLATKQNLSLNAPILNGILIKILKDDDVARGGLRGISRSRGRLRRRL